MNGLTQGNQFNLNDVVKFVCNPGYVAEGAARSQCLASGQWSDVLPTCRSESPFFSSPPPPVPLPSVVCDPQAEASGFHCGATLTKWGRLGTEKNHKWGLSQPLDTATSNFFTGYVKKAKDVHLSK